MPLKTVGGEAAAPIFFLANQKIFIILVPVFPHLQCANEYCGYRGTTALRLGRGDVGLSQGCRACRSTVAAALFMVVMAD